MFTGLVECKGIVRRVVTQGDGRLMSIECRFEDDDLGIDDSVAINGCCLTVTEVGAGVFSTVAVEETLRKTTLGSLRPGDEVNLERAMKLSDRLGGHLVLGHVDDVGEIVSIDERSRSWWVGCRIPSTLMKYIIPVGSITLDGISLTVAAIEGNTIFVSIIPHTWMVTVLSKRKPGDHVNVETDLIGKYIERLTKNEHQPSRITEEWLKEKGF